MLPEDTPPGEHFVFWRRSDARLEGLSALSPTVRLLLRRRRLEGKPPYREESWNRHDTSDQKTSKAQKL